MEDTYVTSKRLESDYPAKLILANHYLSFEFSINLTGSILMLSQVASKVLRTNGCIPNKCARSCVGGPYSKL